MKFWELACTFALWLYRNSNQHRVLSNVTDSLSAMKRHGTIRLTSFCSNSNQYSERPRWSVPNDAKRPLLLSSHISCDQTVCDLTTKRNSLNAKATGRCGALVSLTVKMVVYWSISVIFSETTPVAIPTTLTNNNCVCFDMSLSTYLNRCFSICIRTLRPPQTTRRISLITNPITM